MKVMKSMKKNYIKIMAATMLVFASACSVENEIEGGDPSVTGENTIAFSMGSAATRSASIEEFAEPGAIIPLGKDENGTSYILEESIVDLNTPVTKGTPAYTENVGTLYRSFAAKSELNENGVDAFPYDSNTQKWSKTYDESIWKNSSSLNFYMYMPTDMTGGNNSPVTSLSFADKKISFSYSSPANAADQDDILFSYKELKKSEYNPEKGASILFHHALTGVKFRIGNEASDITNNGIKITNISFKGLFDSGSCTVTPRDEKVVPSGVDNPTDDYSSGDGTTVVWNTKSLGKSGKAISSGTIDGTVDYAQNGSFGEGMPYPNSFASKYNTQNLNKADGSQTFWLIPQPLTGDVKLSITYEINGQSDTWEIDFGTAIGATTWEAGQIRTYTIKIDDVNVKIEDDVKMSENYDSKDFLTAVKSKKENVVITNTGNTPAYIRAAIVGQWIDDKGKPVFAFTEFKDGSIEIHNVPSWYQDQFGSSTVDPTYNFGYFSKLVGYKAPQDGSVAYTGDHWSKGTDGYYYYDEAVPVGEETKEPLFESYTMASVPLITIGAKKQTITFVLEVATQAISAKKVDGTEWGSATAAWENAKQQK